MIKKIKVSSYFLDWKPWFSKQLNNRSHSVPSTTPAEINETSDTQVPCWRITPAPAKPSRRIASKLSPITATKFGSEDSVRTEPNWPPGLKTRPSSSGMSIAWVVSFSEPRECCSVIFLQLIYLECEYTWIIYLKMMIMIIKWNSDRIAI